MKIYLVCTKYTERHCFKTPTSLTTLPILWRCESRGEEKLTGSPLNFYVHWCKDLLIFFFDKPLWESITGIPYHRDHIFVYYYFVDSIRETRRYSKVDATPQVDLHNNPQAEMMVQMKLFRAQRNLYISGFSLFLLM